MYNVAKFGSALARSMQGCRNLGEGRGEGVGWAFASSLLPRFWYSYINPIRIRVADYARRIITPSPWIFRPSYGPDM